MNEILLAILIFLPAGVANMAPVLVKKIPIVNTWNFPIDFYKSLNGVRILGDHKTIRGIVSGVILGTLIGLILYQFPIVKSNFKFGEFILFSAIISFGALLGDSVKSFFKRQFKIQSGKSWFPYDQTDYIFGGLILGSFIYNFTLAQTLGIFVIYFFGHLVACIIGYLLGLKDSWF